KPPHLAELLDDAEAQHPFIAYATSHAWPRRRLDSELFHLAIEVGALDAELSSRVAQIASVGGEAVEDVLPLEARAGLAQGQRAFLADRGGRHVEDAHQVRMADHLLGDQDHHAL